MTISGARFEGVDFEADFSAQATAAVWLSHDVSIRLGFVPILTAYPAI
jgi:hypothetical protein